MQNINWNDTIEFTYPITSGHVIKVYDGDTITIASKMPYENSSLFRFNVRLNGIDTPEIKSKDKNEKALAILARDLGNPLNKLFTISDSNSYWLSPKTRGGNIVCFGKNILH